MDSFLKNSDYLIYSQYVYYCFPDQSSIDYLDNCIVIKNQEHQFEVTLWDSQIIEFQSFHKNQIDYYLHFEFKDFLKSNRLFHEFLFKQRQSSSAYTHMLYQCLYINIFC